uniref:Abnormal spindle-like microcephaly-associated protein ASH domain-containing protein n=1 Tax=Trypanosoma congolense (strain IL3000) TaxID=1068625 RepID=G0UWU3_TRYCI|nr:conserved hypothetical protein [Trypanosoma congolense IL3000]
MLCEPDGREKRRRALGVDCASRLVWRQWEPGCEYTQRLRVRNVDNKSQTIEYQLPLRKSIFYMDFPEPVTLSSGMSVDIKITFCPEDFVDVSDVIGVTVVGRGGFTVYLEGKIPAPELCVPSHYDFGYVAVACTAKRSVSIKNVGNTGASYEWDVPVPFSITPTRGVLNEAEALDLTLSFSPPDACVLVAQAVCKMIGSGSVLAVMKLSGVGKYPFIRLATAADAASYSAATECNPVETSNMTPARSRDTVFMDFGDVYTGNVHTREFTIENPSAVDATFTCDMKGDDAMRSFAVTPKSGTIQRGKTQKFKVSFTPSAPGAAHLAELRVAAQMGNTVTVLMRGLAIFSDVQASVASINFGDVRMDKNGVAPDQKQSLRRSFYIKNLSEVAVSFYTIDTSPGAAFVVRPTTGEIAAKSSVRMWVEFCPTHPINYLRRLHVLLNLAGGVLFIDLFGSAYNSSIRPMPFGLREVDEFFWRHEVGLGAMEPRDVLLLSKMTLGKETSGALQRLLSSIKMDAQRGIHSDPVSCINSCRSIRKASRGKLSFSQFSSPPSASSPFTLSTNTLLFSVESQDSTQYIKVFNNSNTAATAYWCVPHGSGFTVTPMQEDIRPCSHYTFAVTRALDSSTLLRDHYLECYVNYKQMCCFRFVEEGGFIPPQCFTVYCHQALQCGAAEAGSIAPRIRAPSRAIFPKCLVGRTSHTIVEIENARSMVVSFAASLNVISMELGAGDSANSIIEQPPSQPVLLCSPMSGMIPAGGRVPLLLTFCAKDVTHMRGELVLRLNSSPKDDVRVLLLGEGFKPELVIEDSSMVILRPTCVTGTARRSLNVTNPTSISIAFEVTPSPPLQGVVSVEPSTGVLQAGMRIELTVVFSPQGTELYEGHLNFLISAYDEAKVISTMRRGASASAERGKTFNNVDYNSTVKSLDLAGECGTTSIPCMGEGCQSVVEVEPAVIEHEGPAAQEKTYEWTIYNSSVCEVCYEVRWLTQTRGTNWEETTAPMVCLSHNKSGALAARSHTVVLVTLRPPAGVTDCILYTLVGGKGVDLGAIPLPTSLNEVRQHPHCEVHLKGTRPAVQITDVRSLQQHRSQLWCQLAVNNVNAVLAAPVQPVDVEKDSFAFPQYVQGLEPIYMDVGVGTMDNCEKEIMICFENAGSCPAPFRFWYPTDHEGGSETWFIDDEELEDVQQILSNHLLDISPREGTIPVNSHTIITITYRHTCVGTHCLPVLLRLDKGKKVLLVLEGRTTVVGSSLLAFHHPPVYYLHPVALGDVEPPMQSSSIENTSSQPVSYVVQEELLQQVTARNCGVPVFQCMNPRGVIPPGESVQLHWCFRPLEARSYTIDVGLNIMDGENYRLRFCGVGYHPKRTLLGDVCAMINDAFLPIPVLPSLPLPAKLYPVALSIDVMRLGAAPCFSLHRRICYVENRHQSLTYSFAWSTALSPGSSTVEVTPSSGVIGPGQRVRCLIALVCGRLSQVIEAPIFCHVYGETSPASKGSNWVHMETAAVSEEDFDPLLDEKPNSGRSFERTTCTKRRTGCLSRKRLPLAEVPLEYQSVRALSAAAAPVLGSDLASYDMAASQVRKQADPVMAHSLEVLVQARVMTIDQYRCLYGERAVRQLYFPSLIRSYAKRRNAAETQSSPAGDAVACSANRVEVVRRVFDKLIREVIARPQVSGAFTEVFKGETPCYKDLVPQLRSSANKNVLHTHDSRKAQVGHTLQGLTADSAAAVDTAEAPAQLDATKAAISAPSVRRLPSRGGPLFNVVEKFLSDLALQATHSVVQDTLLVTPSGGK